MLDLTDAKILFYANEEAFKKNIHLAPMDCSIYVSLVKYIVNAGSFDKTQGSYFVQLSYRELSEKLECSFKTLCDTLKKLNECKLIVQNQTTKPYVTHIFINELMNSKNN